MQDLRLALRAFWWRRGSSAVVLVVAALTVAAAAIGPLYAAAATESVLQDRLRGATALQTTIAFRMDADVSYPGSIGAVAAAQAERGDLPGYGPVVDWVSVSTAVQGGSSVPAQTQVVWRDNACEHLRLVEGRCPTEVGEVIASERSAEAFGWRLGTVLKFEGLQRYDTSVAGSEVATRGVALKLVGTYRPNSTTEPYWAGRPFFAASPLTAPGGDGPETVDAVFVTRGLFETLVHPTPGSIGSDLVLGHPEALRMADVPALRTAIEGYLGPTAEGPAPTTEVLALLDAVEAERAATTLAAAVVSAQLALLAWLLLFLVITDTSEARGGEVALAKLRGLRPSAVAAVAMREPLVLLLLAVPIGIALAYVATTLLARRLLVPGVPVEMTTWTWVAVGAAFLGGAVAAVLASRRMLTRPVLDQWSTTPGTRHSHRGLGLAADLVLALVALGGFVVLSRSAQDGGGAGALGWVAPGLLVVALALLLVRAAQALLVRSLPATRATPRVGLFLALRQVVRRPAGFRLAALLAVTLGLATFAVDAWATTAAARSVLAGAEVGAVASVAVQPGAGSSAQAAVHEVDPDGRWAAAAVTWLPSGGSVVGTVVGVEADRLAAVAQWAPEYGMGTVDEAAALIGPPLPPPIPLVADRIRVTVDAGPVAEPGPLVMLAYRGTRDVPVTTLAQPLRAGTHTYEAPVPCAEGGCTFYGLTVDRAQDDRPIELDLTLTRLEQQVAGGGWTPVPAGFDEVSRWRVEAYTGTPVGELTAGADGLTYQGEVPARVSPFIAYADRAAPLPVIVAPGALTQTGPTGPVLVDSVGREVPLGVVGRATAVPLGGAEGLLVDLASLSRSAQGPADTGTWRVWLGPDAPDDAVARLEAAGLAVDEVTTLAERETLLGREGPALALRLLLVCALAGAALAAGAVAISVAVTGRRRSYELAALRAVDVPRRALVASCVLEQVVLLGIGLVVGVPVGLLVARLALPLLPRSSGPELLPLLLDVPVGAVAAFTLGTAVVLGVTAVVAGLVLVRQAVPSRLREVAT